MGLFNKSLTPKLKLKPERRSIGRGRMNKMSYSQIKPFDFEKISKAMLLFSTLLVTFVLLCYVSFHNFEHFLPSIGFSTLDGFYSASSGDVMVIKNDEHYEELRKVLKAAATQDKTVILATLNTAWAAPNSVFDLFLESFKIGNNTAWLLNHLLVIAVDDEAFNRCKASVSHCYFLKTNQSSQLTGQADFMSPHYLDIIWQRLAFSRTILSLGYNFVNTDTDVVWFRDPFPQFTLDSDIQFSCDYFNGDEFDMKNLPNVGFMLVRSNSRTIKLYDYWVSSRHSYPELHEQDVFNELKNGSFIKEIGLKMRFLDTNYFGGFCSTSKDFDKVCTMHANCCVGLAKKIADLNTTLQDWKGFLSFRNQISPQKFYWRVPNKCLYNKR